MVEAAPPAPFIITKAEFLLELLIIALDPPAQLGEVDQPIKGDILGQGGKPILGRLGFVLAATRSAATLRRAARLSLVSRCAGRTRCRAKRDESQSALPSRQVMVCHASFGRLESQRLDRDRLMLARRVAATWVVVRCPDRVGGGNGAVPGGQTEVLGPIPGHIAQAESGDLPFAARCRCRNRHPSAPRPQAAPPLAPP